MKKTLSLIATTSALISASASAQTLVAGWDSFSSVASSTASHLAADTTAVLAPGTGGIWDDWNNNTFGASSDETFGNLSTAVASASPFIGTGSNEGTNLSLNRSQKPGSLVITLTNDSLTDRTMEGFYFDGVARFSQSAPDWTLTFSGAISGTAANGTLVSTNMMSASAAQRNQAVDLTGLADNIWEVGTDAIFTINFSGGDPSEGTGGGQETLIDNIGITVVPEPSTLSLLGLSGLALLLRRRRS